MGFTPLQQTWMLCNECNNRFNLFTILYGYLNDVTKDLNYRKFYNITVLGFNEGLKRILQIG